MTETSSLKKEKQRPLGRKMFITILLFSLALLTAGSIFGVFFFRRGIEEAYAKIAFYAGLFNADYFDEYMREQFVPKMLEIYESIPEDIAADPKSEAYMEYFETLNDDEKYVHLSEGLRENTSFQDITAMSLNVFDIDSNRLIYLIDTHDGERYHPVGSYRTLSSTSLYDTAASEVEEFSSQRIVLRSESTGEKIMLSWAFLGNLRSKSGKNYENMIMAEVDMAAVTRKEYVFLAQYLILIMLLTIVLDFFIVKRMRKNVVEPLDKMSAAAKVFAESAENPDEETDAFGKLDIHTDDEIENLSDALKSMEKDRTQKIRDLIALNSEKEHLNAELSVAAQIQNDALPSVFPPFPDRNEFEIYATMDPAREVGGDFYDIIMLDDDHLMITIDDVSGKGIPGALFMMTSKSLIANLARLYPDDPAMVLKQLNEQICENNKASMFVTVWLAVLEISSGRMICTNAGHEYPAIYQNGEFTLLKDKHGLAAGCFETAKFTNYEIHLTPGDAVFVYTDGVPESNNTEGKMYGTDRMLRALNYNRDADMKKLLLSVLTSVREFSSGAEQFDDITMLGLRWYGPDYTNSEEEQ